MWGFEERENDREKERDLYIYGGVKCEHVGVNRVRRREEKLEKENEIWFPIYLCWGVVSIIIFVRFIIILSDFRKLFLFLLFCFLHQFFSLFIYSLFIREIFIWTCDAHSRFAVSSICLRVNCLENIAPKYPESESLCKNLILNNLKFATIIVSLMWV